MLLQVVVVVVSTRGGAPHPYLSPPPPPPHPDQVRLYLDHLNLPEKAFTIVRKTHSAVGAEMVARYCQGVSDFRGAIEFLLMAKRSQDAFELATSHDTMEVFEKALGGEGNPDEYVRHTHMHTHTHVDLSLP